MRYDKSNPPRRGSFMVGAAYSADGSMADTRPPQRREREETTLHDEHATCGFRKPFRAQQCQ